MTSLSVGNLFKGLSQSGAWGCFDEFNTIRIEVLSIIANQTKVCLDAVKNYHNSNKTETQFDFMDGDRITILPTVGFWITMNPG